MDICICEIGELQQSSETQHETTVMYMYFFMEKMFYVITFAVNCHKLALENINFCTVLLLDMKICIQEWKIFLHYRRYCYLPPSCTAAIHLLYYSPISHKIYIFLVWQSLIWQCYQSLIQITLSQCHDDNNEFS